VTAKLHINALLRHPARRIYVTKVICSTSELIFLRGFWIVRSRHDTVDAGKRQHAAWLVTVGSPSPPHRAQRHEGPYDFYAPRRDAGLVAWLSPWSVTLTSSPASRHGRPRSLWSAGRPIQMHDHIFNFDIFIYTDFIFSKVKCLH